MTDIISDILGAVSGSAAATLAFIKASGYIALFLLMTLPVASEVVLPAAGFLAAKGVLSFPFALAAILLGDLVGITIVYSIGYFLGKKVVYEHLQRFNVKKRSLDAFDDWFNRNGASAVFISRLLPEVRGLISFPAGFARMDPKKFYPWAMFGGVIWDGTLMLFGYYALGQTTGVLTISLVGIFILALYLVYRFGMGHINKSNKRKRVKR